MSFDNIIESFSESFAITKATNTTTRCHPKYSQFYKKCNNKDNEDNNDLNSNQEIRRKTFIESQKRNRDQIVMRFRSLLNTNDSNELMDKNEDNCYECMETNTTCDERSSRRKRFYINKYKNQLMLSEWLVEIPLNFKTEWYLVLCPIGKRCLVIGNNGQTKAYSRTGYLMNSFPSLLPGGNRSTSKGRKENCIIDCIFSEIERVFYILDVMSWNGSNFYECETEFRFFWLDSRFESECSAAKQTTKLNPYQFHVLKHFGCDDHQIVEAVRPPHQFSSQLDGLLFYDKRSHYTPGSTPLINWLKLNMVSDILNINLDNENISDQMCI